jgi:hypothetical protein
MDPLIGSLMLFSGVFILFFGLPIGASFLLTRVLGKPQLRTLPNFPTVMPLPTPVDIPILVKKIYHKGKVIWVDA